MYTTCTLVSISFQHNMACKQPNYVASHALASDHKLELARPIIGKILAQNAAM